LKGKREMREDRVRDDGKDMRQEEGREKKITEYLWNWPQHCQY
jgi:hypothetical protein